MTFALLAQAPYRLEYQTEQTRRFVDRSGQLVEIRERLTVQGNSTEESPFRLDCLEVGASDVASPNAAPAADWQSTYLNHAGLLYRHGGFHVHDAAAARVNYSILDFGTARRLEREVRRVVVFPRRPDKAIWLLDVDVNTGLLLYSAEFDARAKLLGELEVTQLHLGAAPITQTPGWQWSPQLAITLLASPAAAASRIRNGVPTTPAVSALTPEYVLDRTHIAENPLNQDQTLVFRYTDGVDEFFVSEAFGGTDPFAVSPVAIHNPTDHTHTIASYDDPGLRAYVFHENGITFQVVGRRSLLRLQGVARRVCQQAVTGS